MMGKTRTGAGILETKRHWIILALAVLLATQILANYQILSRRPHDLNHIPHHYLIFGLEAVRGYPLVHPTTVNTENGFFLAPAFVLQRLGVSEFALKFTTTAYWIAALFLLFASGAFAMDRRAGLLAALVFSAMAFPNNFSRAFDVHVPRMMWELAVLASLLAFLRHRSWIALLPAAGAAYLGTMYAPAISDTPLFLLGVSGAILGTVILKLAQLKRLDQGRFVAALLATLFLGWLVADKWLLHHPGINPGYLFKEIFQFGAGAPSSSSWITRLGLHLGAYPAFLLSIGLGAPMAVLAVASLYPSLKEKGPASRVWIFAFLIPLAALTLVFKKNGYYAAVTLPYLALGMGIGLARILKNRPWGWVIVLGAVLWGNLGVWLDADFRYGTGPFEKAFQSSPSHGYRARPPKDLSLEHRDRLLKTADSACRKDGPCRIALVGILPDQVEIYLPVAIAFPRSRLVKVLDPQIADMGRGPFEIAVINTSAFQEGAGEELKNPFPEAIDMADAELVGGLVEKGISGPRAPYYLKESAKEAVEKALRGLEHLGRFNNLDYYARRKSQSGPPGTM